MTIAFGDVFATFSATFDDADVGVEEVVTAHPGLARDHGRDDDEVGARGLVVAVGADDAGVEELDGRGLPLVEPLALRDALEDVHQHDGPGEFLFGDALGGRRAPVSGADYGA